MTEERNPPADMAEFLARKSKIICEANNCTEDDHRCEVYAYFDGNHRLLDICLSDYFQGCSGPCAAIPLPWSGTQEELDEKIDEELF